MGNRLVGQPKRTSDSSVKDAETEAVLKQLHDQSTRLEKRIAHVQTQIKHAQTQINTYVNQKDKSMATHWMRRSKELAQSLITHQAMLTRLQQQRDALEKTKIHHDTIHVMQAANVHLKQRTTELSPDQAETIIEEVTELKQTVDDISNILSTPIDDGIAQQDLEDEYAQMVAESKQVEPRVPTPTLNPLVLPEAPLPPVGFPVQTQTKTMLEELKTLEALEA